MLILNLEDNRHDAELNHAALEDAGILCELLRVETQRDFLDVIERRDVDIILADYSLPTFNGIEALGIARQRCPNVPFIFVSGALGEEVAIEALKLGATDYVLKDKLLRLAPAVRRAVQEREQKLERVRAEVALRRQAEFLRNVFESLPHPFFVVDVANREVVMANSAAKRPANPGPAYCYALGHHAGHPSDATCQPCLLERIKVSKKPSVMVTTHRGPDGLTTTTEVHGYPILNEQGDLLQMIEYRVDITERVRAEENAKEHQRQLLESSKLATVGLLASGVAHEINNPNFLIMLNTSLLKQAWESITPILERYHNDHGDFVLAGKSYSMMKSEMAQILADTLAGSERIKRIVQELRDFSVRPAENIVECVDMNAVLQSALTLLASTIKKRTVRLEVDCAENLPAVRGSTQRLEQVVINLIHNACQSLPDTSKGIFVITRYDAAEGAVVVEIRDEGVGISQEVLPQILEPFFTTRRESGGTGLGLSISSTIMREHCGRLEFTSTPGSGTTARMVLPQSVEQCGRRQS